MVLGMDDVKTSRPQMDGDKVANWRVAAMASPTSGCRALLASGYVKLEMDLVELEALYREVYERRLAEQRQGSMTLRLSLLTFAVLVGRPIPSHLVTVVDALDKRMSEPEPPRFILDWAGMPQPEGVTSMGPMVPRPNANRHERRKAAALGRHWPGRWRNVVWR